MDFSFDLICASLLCSSITCLRGSDEGTASLGCWSMPNGRSLRVPERPERIFGFSTLVVLGCAACFRGFPSLEYIKEAHVEDSNTWAALDVSRDRKVERSSWTA